MIETDLAYFERRATEEMVRVGEAASPEAASAHRALATAYQAEIVRLRGDGRLRAIPD